MTFYIVTMVGPGPQEALRPSLYPSLPLPLLLGRRLGERGPGPRLTVSAGRGAPKQVTCLGPPSHPLCLCPARW